MSTLHATLKQPPKLQASIQRAGPPGPPGESASVVEYAYNAQTQTPPGKGQMRLDNADQTLAAVMWLDNTADNTADNTDIGNILALQQAGTRLYVQDKDDSSRWQQYRMTANAVSRGTHTEFAIAWLQGAAAIPGGQRVKIMFLTEGIEIEYEGNLMPHRKILVFQGAGVTVADDAVNDRTIITIP